MSVNTKHQKRKEYWFGDRHNNLVLLSLESSNPLLSLMDMTIDKNDIAIHGTVRKSKRDGLEYLKVNDKFTFV